MGREIKFRALGQTDNTWHYGNFSFMTEETVHIVDDSHIWICQTKTMGQYTGLKDKNGKEIYIGDIVNCLEVSNYRTNEYISEVFEEECEVLVHDSINSDTPLATFFPHKEQVPLTEIEVIGNIY